jgi:hypothetical protein
VRFDLRTSGVFGVEIPNRTTADAETRQMLAPTGRKLGASDGKRSTKNEKRGTYKRPAVLPRDLRRPQPSRPDRPGMLMFAPAPRAERRGRRVLVLVSPVLADGYAEACAYTMRQSLTPVNCQGWFPACNSWMAACAIRAKGLSW